MFYHYSVWLIFLLLVIHTYRKKLINLKFNSEYYIIQDM